MVANKLSLIKNLLLPQSWMRQHAGHENQASCSLSSCPYRAENIKLRQQANYWKAQFQRAKAREAQKDEQIQQLQAEIKKLKQDLFGRKSEKTSASEKADDSTTNPAQPDKKPRGQREGGKGHGRRDYSHLPAVEEPHEIPQDDRYCPRCGKLAYTKTIGSEDSETIEIEVKAHRRVIKRTKYVHDGCDCPDLPTVITAPPAPKLIPKSKLGVSVWVTILLNKYHFGVPTQRLLAQLDLHGLNLPAGTVTGGLKRLAPMFEPIYKAIVERNRQADHWHADETRWQVFAEVEGKVGFRHYLWVFAAADSVVFVLDKSRSVNAPHTHFGPDASGILNVDRYSAYKSLLNLGLKLILAWCWAHVRRDFIKLAKAWPDQHDWAMLWVKAIGRLYHLNKQRLKVSDQPEAWAKQQARLAQVLDRMNRRCQKELADPTIHPERRKVMTSLQNHWDGLIVFLDHPHVPMDNNPAERILRLAVIGRKNFYGSGAEWSGELMAMMLSIFATLERCQLNPHQWLTGYLNACAENGGKAPKDITPFLTWPVDNSDSRTPIALANSP